MKWATLATLVLLVGYTAAVLNTRRLSDRIAYLQSKQQGLEQVIQGKRPRWESAAAVDRWQAGQSITATQLKSTWLSCPIPKKSLLTRLEVARGLDGGNSIEIEGVAREPQCVNQLVDTMAANPNTTRHSSVAWKSSKGTFVTVLISL